MTNQPIVSRIIDLQQAVANKRRAELQRALEFRHNPRQAAYHLGLADGHNGIRKALDDLLNASSLKD